MQLDISSVLKLKAVIMNNNFTLQAIAPQIRLKVWGKSYQEMFTAGLVGMFQSIKPESVSCTTVDGVFSCADQPNTRFLKLTALNINTLFIAFLNESLYFAQKHKEAYFSVEFHLLTSTEVRATMHGVSVSEWGGSEIKDVSYVGDAEIEHKEGQHEAVLIMMQ